MASTFTINMKPLLGRIDALPGKIDLAVGSAIQFEAPRATSAMRSGAGWKDQTGNARNGLTATPVHVPGVKHALVLHHSVPYGIWLEVRYSGRYEIILPTVHTSGMSVMRTLSLLMRRIK